MTLLEFISFCTLKDLVIDTFELTKPWHSSLESEAADQPKVKWKIIISDDDVYRVYLAYSVLKNGEGKLMFASVHVRNTQPTKIINNVDLPTIIDMILPQ